MLTAASDEIYEFGPFRLEPREARLLLGGAPVTLTPKVLETLLVLVRRAGSVVTRDELMETLWPDTVVSDGNLKQNVWALRKALEAGAEGAFVETVPRVGYRFVAPVRRVPSSGSRAARPLPPLPRPLTSLVGRTREIAALGALLGRPDVRLVTLTGPGGTGKTRLAIEAARAAAARFADGVAFLRLAPISDPALVLPALAQALGVEEDLFRPTSELLAESLRTRSLLVVLDNFEHLSVAAGAVGELLASTSSVKALVTSRSLLRLSGEHDFPVAPLAAPDLHDLPGPEDVARSEAVTLFSERAAAARPGFSVTSANARAVAEICARLDGLPLALELAASRVRFTAPETLARELEKRLDVLASRARDVEARQRTLRDTIAWSENLLGAEERALFRRASVFAGGFTAEAAAAVAETGDAPAERLEALVDQSLLLVEDGRFAMLETIREFASGRLEDSGEAGRTRGRHAAFYGALARDLAPRLTSGAPAAALARLEREHDNLRAALRFLASEDAGAALELASDLGLFWHLKGHWEEAVDRLRRALAVAPSAPPRPRATALLHLGRLHFFLGAEDDARRELEEGLALARATSDPVLVARLLEAVAQSRMKVGEDASARAALDEALPLARAAGDEAALAETLVTLGAAHVGSGENAAGRAALEEGLALGRAAANGLLVGRALYYLGGLALLEGAPGDVARRDEEARESAEETGDTSWSSHMLEMRGRALAATGRPRDAAPLVRESLESLQEVGSRACLPHSLEAAARLALAADAERAADAVRLLGAAERTCEALGVAMLPVERALFAQTTSAARGRVPAELFEAAWREGRTWTADRALASAAALLTEL